MELRGKRVIAVGERDGVPGPSLAKCARSAGAEVVLEQTHCFVWTAAGALGLEGQEAIKQTATRLGTRDLVVLLGTPTPASSRLYALTVTEGDPAWAGPLAGEALGLPVFHVIEPEVKAQVDAEVYQAEVGMTELALEEPDEIVTAVREVRARSSVGRAE